MKKLISSMLLGVMLFSCMPANAAETPSLDFLKKSYKDSDYANMEQKGEISFILNKPIDVLSELDKYFADTGISNIVNIKGLAEGLFGSKIAVESKQLTSNDGKNISCEVKMKMGSPVVINPNLSLDVNTNYSIWADMDLSGEKDFAINYIMALPFSTKYITMNTEDFTYAETFIVPETDEDNELDENVNGMSEMLKSIFNDEKIDEINNKMVDSIYKNASVSGDKNKVKITFSDIGLKKYIADVFEIAFSLYDDEMIEELDLDEAMKELEDVAKNVPFFGNDAMILEYELDNSQKITNQKAEINVDLNLYDLMKAIDEEPYGMTKENSRLCFTVKGDTKVTYGNAKIVKPELTEENSISFMEYADPYPQYQDYPADEEYFNKYVYVDVDGVFDSENGLKYVPLRNLLEDFEYDISYENGKITAVSDSKYAEHKTIEFVIGSTSVRVDSNSVNIGRAPVIIGDKAYITMGDIEKVMNVRVEYYEYYPNEYYGFVEYIRNAEKEDFAQIK